MNLRILGLLVLVAGLAAGAPPQRAVSVTAPAVVESARRIPVVGAVDVVVVGGTVASVAAAVEAAEEGRSVFVVAPRPHLGEDLCDTLRLWLEEGERPSGALAERIFAGGSPAAPVRVKKTLEEALLRAGVRFLLGCYATDVLVDESGHPAGIVMANRAGRQAVVAKIIIDATPEASIARLAGAELHPWPGGQIEFRRVVLGGEAPNRVAVRRRIPTVDEGHDYFEHVLRFKLPDTDFPSLARAEQQAREETYTPGQLRAAGRLLYVPPNSIVGRRGVKDWRDFDRLHPGHFQPEGIDRIFVAGSRADIPRPAAEKLLRPTTSETVGRFVGSAAARDAAKIPVPTGVRLPSTRAEPVQTGDVREVLSGLRPTDEKLPSIPSGPRAIPVLGSYDVVVIGGGTSGAAAAIGAARRGAAVIVVEYQEGLGGTGTVGLIGKPYYGKNIGFSREVPFPDDEHTIEDKMEWYRREIRKAGGEIWLGVLGTGAFVEGNSVRGAVVATPQQRGVLLAKVVIDATGNADIAVAAGAGSMYGGDPNDVAMQGAGLPIRPPARTYVNTDYLLVDESDMVDVWRALVGARQTMDDSVFDVGPLLQTRERRRIVGDHVLSYVDQIAGRTYPDSIVLSSSDYDSHGYPSDSLFALLPHDEKSRKANHPAPGGSAYTPYRCLLPRGLDGILVTGLGISMHRDASALMRMQRDIANQGYAAGVAAAMAARGNISPRDIDVKVLQRHLVGIGGLPPDVLEHKDSFPLTGEAVRAAVRRLASATNPEEAGEPLAIVLSHRDAALPMLRQAYADASDEHKLVYARLLGFLGVREVIPVLTKALDAMTAWDARILQGVMAEYAHLPTPIDTLILALGHTRDARALRALLRKLEMLDSEVTLSHHRAVAMALEEIGHPTAAEPLARLLNKPGMRGHAMTKLEPLHDKDVARRRRIGPLREITIARALYRCGDYEGLGERILREYQRDIRGLFARHATAVLNAGKNRP